MGRVAAARPLIGPSERGRMSNTLVDHQRRVAAARATAADTPERRRGWRRRGDAGDLPAVVDAGPISKFPTAVDPL